MSKHKTFVQNEADSDGKTVADTLRDLATAVESGDKLTSLIVLSSELESNKVDSMLVGNRVEMIGELTIALENLKGRGGDASSALLEALMRGGHRGSDEQ
jgi:hypothetical protein